MPSKKHKKPKTNKKGYRSPKKSPQRRTDVINDNPVSPSLGDPNAFNFLLEKHSNEVEVFKNILTFCLSIVLILSSYSHILLT